ncbi:carboxypeptidase regulatory-like domain-containing protein [bacterium]|nr:carboxypeptidase regulatory-like domain-containing protein [bacterium]
MKNKVSLLIITVLFIMVLSGCNKKSPTENTPVTFILQGVVRDNGAEYLGSGAEPVENALVSITNQSDSRNIFSGSTNKQGEYSIQISTSGQYKLQVTGNDIETHEQQNLEITGNITLDITVNRTVTDIDGNVYRTIKIGSQWWIAENFKVTNYRNGEAIPKVTNNTTWAVSTAARCAYDNNETIADTYGYLYNWCAVVDSRNIAPEGWHVPTDEEWKELEMYLGMSQSEADDTGSRGRGTYIGSKLAGRAHLWNDGSLENIDAFGVSGFSALPAGYRSSGDGGFGALGRGAYFWSSPESSTYYAWHRYLSYTNSGVNRLRSNLESGFSVRLIRD